MRYVFPRSPYTSVITGLSGFDYACHCGDSPHINAVHSLSLAVAGASYHEYARLLRPHEIYIQSLSGLSCRVRLYNQTQLHLFNLARKDVTDAPAVL